ncbi:BLUF domain-containing protein [Granulosicoccus sp. 3-233]|uniref:BLUF domain-containing protein n=1 Tax=Granulosicoccus sp. 3-233 TaxID=3417969 RepID=UPI003D353801
MNEPLLRVVYVSHNAITGDDAFLTQQIEHILQVARQNNRRVGITGALMFNRGLFAQVLEGPAAAVEETFERIQCDQRHAEVLLLACDPVHKTSFEQWSMAYVGEQAEVPPVLLEIASTTGFDAERIDADAVHDAIRTMLSDA